MIEKPLKIKHNFRNTRIERVEEADLNTEESLLWAVSYSDLLMVLMSFFIIFSSIADEKKDSFIRDLAISIDPKSTKAAMASEKDEVKESKREVPSKWEEENTLKSLSKLFVNTDTKNLRKDEESIHILFPENAFGTRQYELNSELKQNVAKLMEVTKPHWNRLKFTFIGHSDSMPLIDRYDSLIKDNYILSAMRASEAMRYAVHLGVPRENLFLQGSASNTLNARTISVRIEKISP